MKVLLAGGSGVIGRAAIPALLDAGHEVVATARTMSGALSLRDLGVEAVLLDVLDPDAVRQRVATTAPDVVVNMTTALRRQPSFRRLDATMAPTNRLRTEATDLLLAAAAEAGVRRYVGQSFAGWFSEPRPDGDGPAPLLHEPPAAARQTVGALRHLETEVTGWGGEGVVLRFGPLYGPGTSMGSGGSILADVRKRRVPVVGDGGGQWSFTHLDDAGLAVALAVESRATGVFEVVDHEAAPVGTWLPELARVVGAPAPRRMPPWLARPMVGPVGLHLMTAAAAASNREAVERLGFTPRFTSWREGFAHGLGLTEGSAR